MASEPAATTLRSRQRWLLVGIPVVLLFGRGVKSLVQIAMADTRPDRLGIVISLAVLSMVAAVALIVVGRWGWVLAMAILGWDLVGELVLWWCGSPDYVAMFLLAICAFLLTTPEMRADVHGSVAPMTERKPRPQPRPVLASTRRTSICCEPSSRSCGTRRARRSCR